MTSALCLVNGTLPVNGADVAGGGAIHIALQDTGGVSTWSLTCISTDELHSASTVTSGLTVDIVVSAVLAMRSTVSPDVTVLAE